MKNKTNIFIIEDDPFSQKSLSYMLSDESVEIVGQIDNFKLLDKYLETIKIDLIICNVVIQGDVIKKEILKKIRLKGIPILGISSVLDENIYGEIKSFIDGFVVKPFHKITIRSTIMSIMNQYNNSKKHNFISESQLKIKDKKFQLGGVNLSEILYLESKENYCYIYTKEKKLVEKISLRKILLNKLDFRFKRIHHKFAINSEYLEKVEKKEVVLSGDIAIPTSQGYRKILNNLTHKRSIC
jgi:DNA-binding LytR/AlgR family response regulator